MKKIVFGITGLTLGGAERVLVDIVNALCHTYEVKIFTIYGNGELEKELNPNVQVISVYPQQYKSYNQIKKVLFSIFFLLPFYRKYIYNKYIKNKYDVVISFLEGPITNLFSHGPKEKKIAWVHNDIDLVFGSGWKSQLKKKLYMKRYQKYSQLIFVSKDNLQKFIDISDIAVPKRVIYNYIDAERVLKKSDLYEPLVELNIPTFLIVSRLVEQKGISRLIQVHKKLMDDGYFHNIYVIGDGPLAEELKNQVSEHNVTNTFQFLGLQTNPYPYMKKIPYFMLPSHYEGYGMTIAEARILNKTILITDTAAREAVIDYSKAIIVSNNDEGIYEGMKKIITNQDLQVKEEQQDKTNQDNVMTTNIKNDIINMLEGM